MSRHDTHPVRVARLAGDHAGILLAIVTGVSLAVARPGLARAQAPMSAVDERKPYKPGWALGFELAGLYDLHLGDTSGTPVEPVHPNLPGFGFDVWLGNGDWELVAPYMELEITNGHTAAANGPYLDAPLDTTMLAFGVGVRYVPWRLAGNRLAPYVVGKTGVAHLDNRFAEGASGPGFECYGAGCAESKSFSARWGWEVGAGLGIRYLFWAKQSGRTLVGLSFALQTEYVHRFWHGATSEREYPEGSDASTTKAAFSAALNERLSLDSWTTLLLIGYEGRL